MEKGKKNQLFLLLLIVLAAIIILAAGLSEIKLRPGQPFFIGTESLPERDVMEPVSGGGALLTFIRVAFGLALLGLPFAIVYFIISPEFRKRVFKSLLSLLWIYAIYVVLARLPPEALTLEKGIIPAPPQPQDFVPPPVAAFSANPPAWLTFVAAFGLAALFAALLVGFVWRRRQRPASASPLDQLAQEAQDALESLRAGGDLRDVVLRCYFEMIQVLNEQRGIERRSDVTPREFEYHLESVGLPGEHVRRLTRLFEAARYGAKTVGEDEERQAIACLTAIVEACEEAA